MTAVGTIAFCSGEAHIWPSFTTSLAALAARHPNVLLKHMIGTNIAQSRNKAVREMEGDWLYFIDTDMVFGPDTVERLLIHNVDVVQSLCLLRHPPHQAVLYGWNEADKQYKQAVLNSQPPILFEVGGVGTGGTLFRRRVFDALPDPWFEVGQIKTEELGEDLYLSNKIRAAGFKMYTDLTTPIGHITPVTVWPTWYTGGPEPPTWMVGYKLAQGNMVMLPAPRATPLATGSKGEPKLTRSEALAAKGERIRRG